MQSDVVRSTASSLTAHCTIQVSLCCSREAGTVRDSHTHTVACVCVYAECMLLGQHLNGQDRALDRLCCVVSGQVQDSIHRPLRRQMLSYGDGCKGVLCLYILCPYILCPYILCPYILCPYILCPYILCPYILCPYILCPYILCPYILCPYIFLATVILVLLKKGCKCKRNDVTAPETQ